MDETKYASSLDYPSNSKLSKDDQKSPIVRKEKKKAEKIISGVAVKKKKPIGKRLSEVFLGENLKNVGDYLIKDVLIPAAKDMLSDTVRNGLDMYLYGEVRRSKRDRDGKPVVSYGSYYKGREERSRRDETASARARHSFDDIIFDNRPAAEDVLDHLVMLTEDYGLASVADFYGFAGVASEFTDDKYGWTNLSSAKVERVRQGYMISFPRAQLID